MKKIVSLLVLGVVFLTSCTSEDEAGIEETALLKSYEIKKDINGRFTIDYKVNETVVSDFVKNYENGYNEIYLYEASKTTEEGSNSISSKNINLNNNELKVGFYENNAKKKSIIIKDGNIALSKNKKYGSDSQSSPYLREYSVRDLGNDSYELIFVTNDGVSVDFSSKTEDDVFEIHLKSNPNVSSGEFQKIYHKQNDKLQIDFVNFISDNSSFKSEDEPKPTTSKKPVIVFL